MKRLSLFALSALLLFPLGVSARLPNDPEVRQWAYEDVGAYRAWDYTTGSHDVVVAIIDNGFDTFHPDLKDNVWINESEIRGNGIDDDNNGYIDDIWGWDFTPSDQNGDGMTDEVEQKGDNNPRPNVKGLADSAREFNSVSHGTAVAGIIGAKGNNGLDGAGIAWNVRLMNLRVIDESGVGTIFYVPKAIRYAVDNGAHVINISLIGKDTISEVTDAIDYAYENGVLVVAAAGNNSIDMDNHGAFYPVCTDARNTTETVMGVSGIARSHHRSIFSNLGATCIDITAPAEEINSLGRFSPKNGLPDRYIKNWQGTSFAAPLISGAAALIKSLQPSWGAKEIFDVLVKTVHRTPPDDPVWYERVFGAGLLQIDKAVKEALSHISSHHSVERVMSLSRTGNKFVEDGDFTGGVTIPDDVYFGVDDIIHFHKDGSRYYATVSQVRGGVRVRVYSPSWVMQNEWTAPTRGKLHLLAGDLLGDSAPEIALIPNYRSQTWYRVFSLDGELLKEVELGAESFSSATVVGMDQKEKTIALARRTSGGTEVIQMNRDHKIDSRFIVDYLKNPNMGSGDINGDGVQELVLTGGAGEQPWVGTYTLGGGILRRFWAFDPGYRGGVLAEVGDYDGDAQDELILGSESQIRVFESNIRRTASWETGLRQDLLLVD